MVWFLSSSIDRDLSFTPKCANIPPFLINMIFVTNSFPPLLLLSFLDFYEVGAREKIKANLNTVWIFIPQTMR